MTRRCALEAATEVLANELLQQICTSDSQQICHEVFERDVKLRLQTLKDCQRRVEIQTLGRVFRKWKAQFSSKVLVVLYQRVLGLNISKILHNLCDQCKCMWKTFKCDVT